MISKQILFNTVLKEQFSPQDRSAQSWIIILGFVFLITACYFTSTASLHLVFPATSFLVGLFLYLRHPIHYIGFTWWIWFLTPLITRLVDYRVGWDPTRQMLIAPYLVVFLTIFTFLKHLPSSLRQGGLPFLLAVIGVSYGCLIGLIYNQPLPVVRSFLDWLSPIIFAFHLFSNWRDYPTYRQHLQRTFIWCVIILGSYGVYQFVVAPEWDRYWLIQSKMFTSAGDPIPFGMRIWSTLHSSGPFGTVMQTGLLLLFTTTGPLIFPASAVGYLSFLLSQVRTSWGGWLLGIIMIFGSVKPQIQMRLMTIILVMTICVIPLVTIEPLSKVITTRMESFSNLEKDGSFRDRSATYDRSLNLALSNVIGNGFGNTWKVNEKTGQIEVVVIDSGILDMFFTLGWIGAIPYISGLVLMLITVGNYTEGRFDSFLSAARAIGISSCAQLIIYSGMLSISGMIMWGFLAMAMAGHKYYSRSQKLGL
ncbi:O-antigen ligase family protein [Aphanizomenon flos-aquae NRERC-008]|uniref:O-antigen ligase family protein n=1 Tax=Aphanizomenon flos-aquae FACHB-1249 TaxID=2692889 RepID=A0ABR8IQ18_APHFL|nr:MULTISPECIES: O-antigen ligase family protein [Aphanizomenon]MBD2390140.1 O-antigen ligase family protein [Aphanizomenon flos-aquae FACHB-1171]MBD2556566.1 O-antigen ligase family protein [Aphanizomenon flos-aquae FACHB-1290]MBD2631146.1 O-antigen ligase family protein [Aphanizomenon sp. FACHB-1399]MBD2642038.1 O-antigen ligase family protein [Aphanizomenon sp. FACHB-1401]MBD2657022.1 O-antigen ligase family protein [Aphanizomenon flos-aquae FACHB-1265]